NLSPRGVVAIGDEAIVNRGDRGEQSRGIEGAHSRRHGATKARRARGLSTVGDTEQLAEIPGAVVVHLVLERYRRAMRRLACLICSLPLVLACSSSDGGRSTNGESASTADDSSTEPCNDHSEGDGDGDGDSSGDGDGYTSGGGDGDADDGPKLDLGTESDLPEVALVPVKDLPNLESITFYERTGGVAPDSFTFTVDGPELTVR